MDEQRENMQNGMIENETTGEQKPDGGKERRRRGMGAGILLGICGTLVVGALGIYLTCRFTGSQITHHQCSGRYGRNDPAGCKDNRKDQRTVSLR